MIGTNPVPNGGGGMGIFWKGGEVEGFVRGAGVRFV
jgi:hypothetical protein